ncbi:chemotaxis protein CheB [Streptomyces spectabilis]|uniref:protein-glutamate methylesterase n=1 Tax=Streptomyces spectabilis TaxID=68270 RepID=A0A7W8B247_STRST|nr:chemotaxis protein CheB [Streptomyces spectabilis]MBB5108918.1 two-component system chemotaxis response regulator CheB [Streptomyces spectabilis]MCI3899789.1 chemotaxis protein CheB [Streptomyces spectabilis]
MNTDSSSASDHCCVLLAASAGGVEGLGTLLGGLSSELPAFVLVVQHLRRGRETKIVPVLSRRTGLQVKLAQDGEEPRLGSVYIAPPDQHLCVRTAGKLALTQEAPVKFSRPAADPLFESAAKAYGSKTIACVLTGTDGDGTRGITAVKAHGGTVIVQDPDTAEFHGMPRSAINTGLTDLVLPLKDIAPTIMRLVRR